MRQEDLRRELEEAQKTVRELREELAETNRGLLALNDELEDRVAERTTQLEAANEALRAEIVERKKAQAERESLLAAEQKARNQAEAAVRIREEFISVAAHELKTPVVSLWGYAQLVQRQFEKTGVVNPERVLTAMAAILRQSKKLSKLTEQLLDVSRMEAGKLVLVPEEANLVALVEGIVATMRLSHPDRAIEFRNGPDISAVVDPLRLEQVITNLIDNAVKFSPPQSSVEVNIDDGEAGWVRIEVRDHGVGVPEASRTRIFERFYQAEVQLHYGGMGIGLYVSRQITEMHGGSLAVEQPADGGSRFVIRLPLGGVPAKRG